MRRRRAARIVTSFDALHDALLAWETARHDHDVAVSRLAKQRARFPAVCRALKMTEHEVQMQLHWAHTNTRPRSGHDSAAARRWANRTAFQRSKLAQDWLAKLARSEAEERAACARLAEVARALVALIGLHDAALATGESEGQLRALCRAAARAPSLPVHEHTTD